ncbi:MAG: hypothetical protein QM488_12590 [Rhizobiaceae bacterium]
MDLNDFYRRYGMPAIEVQFRWNALATSTQIEVLHLNTIGELAALHTAWYAPQENEGTDFQDINKQNLLVGTVATDLNLVPNHRDRIGQWVQRLKSDKIKLVFPVYGLPKSEYFLLDGNHRAVAAVIGETIPVTLHVLRGEISNSILPDLWRWKDEEA